jgi:hypothetical protein
LRKIPKTRRRRFAASSHAIGNSDSGQIGAAVFRNEARNNDKRIPARNKNGSARSQKTGEMRRKASKFQVKTSSRKSTNELSLSLSLLLSLLLSRSLALAGFRAFCAPFVVAIIIVTLINVELISVSSQQEDVTSREISLSPSLYLSLSLDVTRMPRCSRAIAAGSRTTMIKNLDQDHARSLTLHLRGREVTI